MSALLEIPDGPLWYRQFVVLESYIKAVVCWNVHRFPVVDAEEKWRPLAAKVWLEREDTADDVLRLLDDIVKHEGYHLSARQILNNAVQRWRHEEARREYRARIELRCKVLAIEFGPDNSVSVDLRSTAERQVRSEIEKGCLARGYSEWYGTPMGRALR